jgi:CheY-like chemotaxis protein
MSEEKHMPPTQILLPEDERIINTELEQRLAHLGYAVVAMASSGAEAIERAHELCPDLVLAHIGLVRGMSGVDAAAHTWDEGKIHVVSVTAYANEQTLTQARTPVPVLAIHKPLDIRQLQSTIEQSLSKPPPDQT